MRERKREKRRKEKISAASRTRVGNSHVEEKRVEHSHRIEWVRGRNEEENRSPPRVPEVGTTRVRERKKKKEGRRRIACVGGKKRLARAVVTRCNRYCDIFGVPTRIFPHHPLIARSGSSLLRAQIEKSNLSRVFSEGAHSGRYGRKIRIGRDARERVMDHLTVHSFSNCSSVSSSSTRSSRDRQDGKDGLTPGRKEQTVR
ncbi:hypothetical protein DMN91_001034 [Ooceraea biroi]|uniref:Uncharacterized protein n=1 Tax=Ooceraea biroi TaxID=2015173 RepID=A0A3L8E3E9_OOCBI|nr:hypothetical protein DMN91_001034 [Ooceraea biroi]